VLESAHPKDGYFIARKNFFLGRWIKRCGWYPDFNLRLFQKGKGLFGIREVHEAVKLDGVAGHLEFPMEHHTYKSLEDFMKRLDRYSTLAAQELLKEKKTYGILHIVFRPLYTFISMYFLRLGFLEGYYGFILSVLYAFYTFLKYIKLRELQSSES
ncbi:MAG TPA: glycosyltransferase family 2 protein, partial [Smithella sp.]|nr:glycosyltransferase family 2 protein [Smithella sp.]HQI73382.1 glycosyltransferase family 2 protein [Smithella sp.]